MFGNFSFCVMLLSLIGAVVHAAWWYPSLPELVPSHFDANGIPNPNSMMSRSSFVIMFLGLQFFMTFMMAGIAIGLRYLPKELLNIPNKEYWLADERVEETFEINRITLYWIASATIALFVVVFQQSALVGIGQQNSLGLVFGIVLVAYLVFVFGVCGYLMYRFRIPKSETDSSLGS